MRKKLKQEKDSELSKAKKTLVETKRELVDLECEILILTSTETFETKSHGQGQYNEDIEKCIMELVGELDVSTIKAA